MAGDKLREPCSPAPGAWLLLSFSASPSCQGAAGCGPRTCPRSAHHPRSTARLPAAEWLQAPWASKKPGFVTCASAGRNQPVLPKPGNRLPGAQRCPLTQHARRFCFLALFRRNNRKWGRGWGAGGERRPPGSIPDHQLRKDRGNGQQGPQKCHLKGLQVSDSRLPQVRAGAPGQEHRAGLAM